MPVWFYSNGTIQARGKAGVEFPLSYQEPVPHNIMLNGTDEGGSVLVSLTGGEEKLKAYLLALQEQSVSMDSGVLLRFVGGTAEELAQWAEERNIK